eukprot:306677-Rhodomonas_salina.3
MVRRLRLDGCNFGIEGWFRVHSSGSSAKDPAPHPALHSQRRLPPLPHLLPSATNVMPWHPFIASRRGTPSSPREEARQLTLRLLRYDNDESDSAVDQAEEELYNSVGTPLSYHAPATPCSLLT